MKFLIVEPSPLPILIPLEPKYSPGVLNTISLKCCLTSTAAIDRRRRNSRMRMKVQDRLMQTRFIEIHQIFAKNKIGRILL